MLLLQSMAPGVIKAARHTASQPDRATEPVRDARERAQGATACKVAPFFGAEREDTTNANAESRAHCRAQAEHTEQPLN